MRRLLAGAFVVAAVATGCLPASESDSRSAAETESARDCARDVARLRSEWIRTLARGALEDPNTRFPNLSPAEFQARLDELADRYSVRVVDVAWLDPQQAAPAVVLQWRDPKALADLEKISREVDVLVSVLNRLEGEADLPSKGRRFEGFFLEARDASGIPFLAISSHWRGSDRGGGRWTRFDELVLRGSPFVNRDINCLPSRQRAG